MEIDLKKLTVKQAHDHLVEGDFSARELTQKYLEEIEDKNPDINAYLEVFDDALEEADRADARIKKEGKDVGSLVGIPIAMKDNILIQGKASSCASKILEPYKGAYDATVTKKLKDAGAVFLGRANMDEFAMGSSNEHSAFGVVKNPHDLTRSPGGSSGGPAATVAMEGALCALGSDTGGSIRQPASFCGVVGMKPTYGAVSRYGLIALGSSLDQIGPLAKTVGDARILFDAVKGYDPKDATSLELKKEEADFPKKIGVPTYLKEGDGMEDDVRANFEDSLKKIKEMGYEIKDIELPSVKYSLPIYYVIMPAEASANLARFDGVRYGLYKGGSSLLEDYTKTRGSGFGEEVRRRIILGTYVLSSGYYDAYYSQARRVRGIIRSEFRKIFEDVSFVVSPTSPSCAFKLGEKTNDPLSMYLADIFTVPANIAGLPAISVPSGMAKRGEKDLPLGLQFIAPHSEDERLFEVGEQFEKIKD